MNTLKIVFKIFEKYLLECLFLLKLQALEPAALFHTKNEQLIPFLKDLTTFSLKLYL